MTGMGFPSMCYILTRMSAPWGQGFVSILLSTCHLHRLEQWLVHNRHSLIMCWIKYLLLNEWSSQGKLERALERILHWLLSMLNSRLLGEVKLWAQVICGLIMIETFCGWERRVTKNCWACSFSPVLLASMLSIPWSPEWEMYWDWCMASVRVWGSCWLKKKLLTVAMITWPWSNQLSHSSLLTHWESNLALCIPERTLDPVRIQYSFMLWKVPVQ